MTEAVAETGVLMTRVSFKGTVNAVSELLRRNVRGPEQG